MRQILINNTRGKDHVERASLAFVTANIALTSGQEAIVLLTIEGVRVATRGYADELQAHGFPPLRDLIKQFVDNGGRLWVCGACAKPRDITDTDLIEGAKIVGAASAVEALVNGAASLSF
jgi:predicted peroxiredoxin